MPRHFLVDDDLTPFEQESVLEDAARRKKDRYVDPVLAGPRSVAVLCEAPSIRTRVTFEAGIAELGGHPLVVDATGALGGSGETIEDAARGLSRCVAAIVIRTPGQDRVERLAEAAGVPVVNALTDFAHPCQALADLLTIREHRGGLSGLTLAYLGDGSTIAHSLLLAGVMAGMRVRVATPAGFEPIEQVVRRANRIGKCTGGAAVVLNDPLAAARGADVLYTDAWGARGQQGAAADSRRLVFSMFQIDDRAVESARDNVIVMHRLPAHRGEEIAAQVLDGPRSVVWDQAENRLHVQKALLAFLVERA